MGAGVGGGNALTAGAGLVRTQTLITLCFALDARPSISHVVISPGCWQRQPGASSKDRCSRDFPKIGGGILAAATGSFSGQEVSFHRCKTIELQNFTHGGVRN